MSHIGGRDDFLPSLPFSSVILSINVFLDCMVQSSKGLLEYLHLYASYRLFDSSVRPGTYSVRHPLSMCLPDATHTLSTKHLYLAGIGSTSSISLSSSAEYPFQSGYMKLKRRLKGIVCGTMTGWALTQLGRCWVCRLVSMIDFLHMRAMLPDANMRSGL